MMHIWLILSCDAAIGMYTCNTSSSKLYRRVISNKRRSQCGAAAVLTMTYKSYQPQRYDYSNEEGKRLE